MPPVTDKTAVERQDGPRISARWHQAVLIFTRLCWRNLDMGGKCAHGCSAPLRLRECPSWSPLLLGGLWRPHVHEVTLKPHTSTC